MKKSLILAFAALLMLTAAVPDKTTTIFIIGDSTAANKDISGGKQERGWGMALQCYFDDNILVRSSAKVVGTRCWNASSQVTMSSFSLATMMRRQGPTVIATQVPPSTTIWPSMCAKHVNMAAFPC